MGVCEVDMISEGGVTSEADMIVEVYSGDYVWLSGSKGFRNVVEE